MRRRALLTGWRGLAALTGLPAPATTAAATAAPPLVRAASSSSATAAGPLIGVCVLERLPVITPTPPAWRTEYAAWQEGVHAGRAKAYPRDLGASPSGRGGAGGEEDQASSSSSSSSAWAPAPRTTAADEAGDTGSLQRALDRRLFLVLTGGGSGGGGGGGGGGGSAPWRFPAAAHGGGDEPIRAAAERAFASALIPAPGSPPLEAYFVGNAPAGHLPAAAGGAAAPSEGGTLFFHRAQLLAGTPAPASPADGPVAWLTKEELAERAGPGPLADLVKAML